MNTFWSGLIARHRQAVPFLILSINADFIAGDWIEVRDEGGNCVPGHRHGHIIAIDVICWLELNQIGLDVGGIDLPGGQEAFGANLWEGQVPGWDQF